MCFFTYYSTDYPPLRKHSGSEVSSAGDCLGLWVLPKWAGRLSITDCQVGGGLIRWEYKEKEDVMKYRMFWRSSLKIMIYYKKILFRPALHTSSSPRITRLEMMIKSLKRILMLKWAGLETPCLSITDCKVGGGEESWLMLTKMRLFDLYMGPVEGGIRNETTTAFLGLRMGWETLLVNIIDRVRAVRGDLTTGTTVGIMIEGSVIAEDDQMWICVILPDQIWHSTLM